MLKNPKLKMFNESFPFTLTTRRRFYSIFLSLVTALVSSPRTLHVYTSFTHTRGILFFFRL